MLRFRLNELIAEKGFRERRVVTIAEVAEGTNIHRATLSKLAHQPGANTVTDNIDKLCRYFGCAVSDVMTYIDD